MKMKKYNMCLRTVSFSLAVLFTFNTIAWSAPVSKPAQAAASSQKLISDFQIPKEIGTIEETYFPPQASPASPVIIHIRDAHAQPEAQQNIEKILEVLSSQKKINSVAVEAGFGKTDASILNLLPDAAANRAVAEALLNMGELSGAGLFAANFPSSANVYGVEDKNLYKESLSIFRRLKSSKTELGTLLQDYQTALEAAESRIFNAELKDYVIKKRAWENHRDLSMDYFLLLTKLAKTHLSLDLADARNQAEWPYIIRLLKIREIESGMDLESARKESAQLKAQIDSSKNQDSAYFSAGIEALAKNSEPFESWMAKNPYHASSSARIFFEALWQEIKERNIAVVAYPQFSKLGGLAILRQEIEPELLFKETSKLENSLEEKMFLSVEQKQLSETGKNLILLSKLLSLQMSREDYEKFLERKETLVPEKLAADFQKFSSETSIRPFPKNFLIDAENFYVLSLKRDQTLIENTLRFAGSKPAILIAGGFHSEGLTRILKSKNIPFISVTPKMTRIGDESLYEKAMMGSNSDVKNLFPSLSVLGVLEFISRSDVYAEIAGPQKQGLLLLRALLTAGIPKLELTNPTAENIYLTLQRALENRPDIFRDIKISWYQNIPTQLATGKKKADLIRVQSQSLGIDITFAVSSGGRLIEAKPAIRLPEMGAEQDGVKTINRSEVRGISRRAFIAGAVLVSGGLVLTGYKLWENQKREAELSVGRARHFEVDLPGKFSPNYLNPVTYSFDEMKALHASVIEGIEAEIGENFDTSNTIHITRLAEFYKLTEEVNEEEGSSPLMKPEDIVWWADFSRVRKIKPQELSEIFFWRWQVREVIFHYGSSVKTQGEISALAEPSQWRRSIETSLYAHHRKAKRNRDDFPRRAGLPRSEVRQLVRSRLTLNELGERVMLSNVPIAAPDFETALIRPSESRVNNLSGLSFRSQSNSQFDFEIQDNGTDQSVFLVDNRTEIPVKVLVATLFDGQTLGPADVNPEGTYALVNILSAEGAAEIGKVLLYDIANGQSVQPDHVDSVTGQSLGTSTLSGRINYNGYYFSNGLVVINTHERSLVSGETSLHAGILNLLSPEPRFTSSSFVGIDFDSGIRETFHSGQLLFGGTALIPLYNGSQQLFYVDAVGIYEVATGKVQIKNVPNFGQPVIRALSPDDHTVIAASTVNTIYIVPTDSQSSALSLSLPAPPVSRLVSAQFINNTLVYLTLENGKTYFLTLNPLINTENKLLPASAVKTVPAKNNPNFSFISVKDGAKTNVLLKDNRSGNLTLIKTLAAGETPGMMDVSPNGSHALVDVMYRKGNVATGEVVIFDINTGNVLGAEKIDSLTGAPLGQFPVSGRVTSSGFRFAGGFVTFNLYTQNASTHATLQNSGTVLNLNTAIPKWTALGVFRSVQYQPIFTPRKDKLIFEVVKPGQIAVGIYDTSAGTFSTQKVPNAGFSGTKTVSTDGQTVIVSGSTNAVYVVPVKNLQLPAKMVRIPVPAGVTAASQRMVQAIFISETLVKITTLSGRSYLLNTDKTETPVSLLSRTANLAVFERYADSQQSQLTGEAESALKFGENLNFHYDVIPDGSFASAVFTFDDFGTVPVESFDLRKGISFGISSADTKWVKVEFQDAKGNKAAFHVSVSAKDKIINFSAANFKSFPKFKPAEARFVAVTVEKYQAPAKKNIANLVGNVKIRIAAEPVLLPVTPDPSNPAITNVPLLQNGEKPELITFASEGSQSFVRDLPPQGIHIEYTGADADAFGGVFFSYDGQGINLNQTFPQGIVFGLSSLQASVENLFLEIKDADGHQLQIPILGVTDQEAVFKLNLSDFEGRGVDLTHIKTFSLVLKGAGEKQFFLNWGSFIVIPTINPRSELRAVAKQVRNAPLEFLAEAQVGEQPVVVMAEKDREFGQIYVWIQKVGQQGGASQILLKPEIEGNSVTAAEAAVTVANYLETWVAAGALDINRPSSHIGYFVAPLAMALDGTQETSKLKAGDVMFVSLKKVTELTEKAKRRSEIRSTRSDVVVRDNVELPKRSELRSHRPVEEQHTILEIVRLIEALDAKGIRAKVHGRDLLEFGSQGEALVSFIQRYSILKSTDDIRRVLSWRLDIESKSGMPLNGMDTAKTAEKTKLLFESIFDQPLFLKHWSERNAKTSQPLNVVFFRRGESGAEITHLLRSLPNVNIKIILSATDDGLAWFDAAREFKATGVPGAGKALLDLAQDSYVKEFLAYRLNGNQRTDDQLLEDFTAFVSKLKSPTDSSIELSNEMRILFQKAMRIEVRKRQELARFLAKFLEESRAHRQAQTGSVFKLRNLSMRSLSILGAAFEFRANKSQNEWQDAVDKIAALLDIKEGNRVIFPTRERQHLLAVREDGTVYFSETGINQFETGAPFLGLWLVSQTVDEAFIRDIQRRLHEAGIALEELPAEALASGISAVNRSEVYATTKKVGAENALKIAKLFSEISTTSAADKGKVISITPEADDALRKADITFYTTALLETNVGAALIVPGVNDAVKANAKAAKIILVETPGSGETNESLDALHRINHYLNHSAAETDLTGVEGSVDFVLAGLLHGLDPRKISGLLAETEKATEGKVPAVAVDARTNEKYGFYGSPALSEAMIALLGVKTAGFRISDSHGLMPDAKAVELKSRETNQAGLFRKKQDVQGLIQEIKTNFESIVKSGAFAFDVDMTLLPKNADALTDYPELAYLLMRLLREGVTVTIISGNSFEEQGVRILDAIKEEMKDDLSALKNLIFYVSGGATRFNLNEQGDVIPDVEYNREHELDLAVLRPAVDRVLTEMAQDNFGLNAEELEKLDAETKNKISKLKLVMPWKDGGSWTPEWVTPAQVQERKALGQSMAFPWIEIRGDFITPGQIIASITIKPMQVFELQGRTIDIRNEFQARLRAVLGESAGHFVIRSGGSSSTDITGSTANKNVALKNLIKTKKLNPKWVVYFGDEFYLRKVSTKTGPVNQLGNDEAIAVDPDLLDVRTLALNASNMEGASPKTIWIGRTPQAALEFLEAVLITSEEITSRFQNLHRSELRMDLQTVGMITGAGIVAVGVLAVAGKYAFQRYARPVEWFLGYAKKGEHKKAVEGLIRLGVGSSIKLYSALTDKDSRVRRAAVEALGRPAGTAQAYTPQALAHTFMNDPMADIRQAAFDSLENINPGSAVLAPIYLKAVESSKADVREMAEQGLKRLGVRKAERLPVYRQVFKNGPLEVRIHAVKKLGELKDLKTLEQRLKDLENPMEYAAYRIALREALMLAGVEKEKLVAIFLRNINASDEDLKIEAIEALGNLKSAEAQNPLIKLLNHSSPEIRAAAQEALRKMMPVEKLSEVYLKFLSTETGRVLLDAVNFFTSVKNPRAIAPILALRTSSKDYSVRFAARNALLSLGAKDALIAAELAIGPQELLKEKMLYQNIDLTQVRFDQIPQTVYDSIARITSAGSYFTVGFSPERFDVTPGYTENVEYEMMGELVRESVEHPESTQHDLQAVVIHESRSEMRMELITLQNGLIAAGVVGASFLIAAGIQYWQIQKRIKREAEKRDAEREKENDAIIEAKKTAFPKAFEWLNAHAAEAVASAYSGGEPYQFTGLIWTQVPDELLSEIERKLNAGEDFQIQLHQDGAGYVYYVNPTGTPYNGPIWGYEMTSIPGERTPSNEVGTFSVVSRSEMRAMSESDFINFFDRAVKSGKFSQAAVAFSGGEKEVAFQVTSVGDVLRAQSRAVVIQKDAMGYTTISVRYANPTFWDNRYVLAEGNLGKSFDMSGASSIVDKVVNALKEGKTPAEAIAVRSEMRTVPGEIQKERETLLAQLQPFLEFAEGDKVLKALAEAGGYQSRHGDTYADKMLISGAWYSLDKLPSNAQRIIFALRRQQSPILSEAEVKEMLQRGYRKFSREELLAKLEELSKKGESGRLLGLLRRQAGLGTQDLPINRYENSGQIPSLDELVKITVELAKHYKNEKRTGGQARLKVAELRKFISDAFSAQVAKSTKTELKVVRYLVLEAPLTKLRSEMRGNPVVSIQNLEPAETLTTLIDFYSRVQKERKTKGSGNLITVVTLSDPHADMRRFDPLILDPIRRVLPEGMIPADFKLDKTKPLFDQLKQFGVTPEVLIGKIFFHNNGDIPDRGNEAIKVADRSEELIEKGLSDFIIGNHDLWAFLNLWGFHLPWYEGFNFYDYSDPYDKKEISMKVQNLIRNAHTEMPETYGENAKTWWAKRLAEYIEFYANLQKKEWSQRFEQKVNGTIDPSDPGKTKRLPGTGMFAPIEDLFKEDKARKKEDQKYKKHRDLWSQLRGRNISDTEIYTGVRAVGTVSVQWWRDLLAAFKEVQDDAGFAAEPENLRTAWAQAVDMMEKEIIPETAGLLDKKLNEKDAENPNGKWWWRIFEAINYKNYTSVEWWARDWSSHKDWGTAVIEELNKEIEEENKLIADPDKKIPLVTQANYLDHPKLQKMARFFRKNFNLYTRDIYQNVYLHAFLPVDSKTGEFFFQYRGVKYRGKGNSEKGIPSVWEGLTKIGEDVRNPALSPLDLYEALNLVNSWYADNTTIAKATHVIGAIQTFGTAHLSAVNDAPRLFNGHIPATDYLKQVKAGQKSVITGFNTGDWFFNSDQGAAMKFGGRGGGIITGSEGTYLYGYTHKDSTVIVDHPQTLSDDATKVLFENPGIERDKFLDTLSGDVANAILNLMALPVIRMTGGTVWTPAEIKADEAGALSISVPYEVVSKLPSGLNTGPVPGDAVRTALSEAGYDSQDYEIVSFSEKAGEYGLKIIFKNVKVKTASPRSELRVNDQGTLAEKVAKLPDYIQTMRSLASQLTGKTLEENGVELVKYDARGIRFPILEFKVRETSGDKLYRLTYVKDQSLSPDTDQTITGWQLTVFKAPVRNDGWDKVEWQYSFYDGGAAIRHDNNFYRYERTINSYVSAVQSFLFETSGKVMSFKITADQDTFWSSLKEDPIYTAVVSHGVLIPDSRSELRAISRSVQSFYAYQLFGIDLKNEIKKAGKHVQSVELFGVPFILSTEKMESDEYQNITFEVVQKLTKTSPRNEKGAPYFKYSFVPVSDSADSKVILRVERLPEQQAPAVLGDETGETEPRSELRLSQQSQLPSAAGIKKQGTGSNQNFDVLFPNRRVSNILGVANGLSRRIIAVPDLQVPGFWPYAQNIFGFAGTDGAVLTTGFSSAFLSGEISTVSTGGIVSQRTGIAPRIVILKGDTGLTENDLKAMQLVPGSHVIILDQPGSDSLVWNRYSKLRLGASGDIRPKRILVSEAEEVTEIKSLFSKFPQSIPVLVLPSGTPHDDLTFFAGTASQEGFVVSSPKTPDARLAFTALLGRVKPSLLRQQVPDELVAFNFRSDSLSPVSIQPGAENRFAHWAQTAMSQQRFAVSA